MVCQCDWETIGAVFDVSYDWGLNLVYLGREQNKWMVNERNKRTAEQSPLKSGSRKTCYRS